MTSVLRVFGRFGAVMVLVAPVCLGGTESAARDRCVAMPDGQMICNPTPEDEEWFKENSTQPLLPEPPRPADAAACRVDRKKGLALLSPVAAENASFDDRLCAFMLSTGALPFGASHEEWLNPEWALTPQRYPVWASIRVGKEDPWLYVSQVNASRANRFWPFHLKQFGGAPLRYTLVAYRPSEPTPVEQFSSAEQMRLCKHDFRQQIRKAETFLGVKLSRIRETLLERGIFTIVDGARRPGYFVEGEFIRMEIWLGLMSTLKKGGAAKGLCQPFLFFQDLPASRADGSRSPAGDGAG